MCILMFVCVCVGCMREGEREREREREREYAGPGKERLGSQFNRLFPLGVKVVGDIIEANGIHRM